MVEEPASGGDGGHGGEAGRRNLVFIADGTFATLTRGRETNAGLLYRLLRETGPTARQLFAYDPGIQGIGPGKWFNAATGRGINLAICEGYAFLASRYRPGDRVFLFGYSRGAYAVRSLAGMIGMVGLLRREHATQRNISRAFRLYERSVRDTLKEEMVRDRFAREHCHGDGHADGHGDNHGNVGIECLGVWDTVRALGLPYPILSRLGGLAADFHDHALGPHIRHGYHALALDEDRTAYAPILWQRSPNWQGRLEQAWFPGAHGDVGGDLRGREEARPLANIALNWMLRRAVRLGLSLPGGWEARFPEDPAAPSVGNRRGINRLFLLRVPRLTGTGDGELIHLSVRERMERHPDYRPLARTPDGTEMAPPAAPG